MSRRTTRATADAFSAMSSQQNVGNHIAPNTAMYMHNQYNHPAFNKLYLGPNLSQSGKSHTAASAVPKPPKAPEKPLMPYMRYSRKVWDEVKASQPDLKLWEIGKIIGKMWRELPSSDRQLYIDEYDTEKAEYQDLLRSYHNSPAYQGYLQAKGRAEAIENENRSAERDDSCMSIEPADDGAGDTDEGFSVKHVAAARFQRNHRLMQDILSESGMVGVPSSRGIVTEKRLEILKKQVHSLENHQTQLQRELSELEQNHAVTKRKWKESANAFACEVKRLRSLTPQEYYLEHKKKQKVLKMNAQKEIAERTAQAEKEASKTSDKNEADEKTSVATTEDSSGVSAAKLEKTNEDSVQKEETEAVDAKPEPSPEIVKDDDKSKADALVEEKKESEEKENEAETIQSDNSTVKADTKELPKETELCDPASNEVKQDQETNATENKEAAEAIE